MRPVLCFFGAAALSLLAVTAAAEVKLDDCFGDNMVIQRELPARFRGTAAPGEKVTLKFAGQTVTTKANANGDWQVTLRPLRASKTPATLTVTGEGNTVTLKNLLVGEVWLCTGQSNMAYNLYRQTPGYVHRDQEVLVAAANYPMIRLLDVPRRISAAPRRSVGTAWEPVTPESIKEFSAVGYFFGVELFKTLDVPIGLVNSNWGGTRIEPWISLDGFRSLPEGKYLAASITGRTGGTPEFRANAEKFLREQRAWLDKSAAAISKDQVPPLPPALPEAFRDAYNVTRETPAALYNAMIHPLSGMTVRGAIWYQGESNRHEWYDYRWQMHALLNGWKLAFDNPEFQFHFVQIAPYVYQKELPMICFGLWLAQQQFADESGCGMAVINDCGDIKNIHPDDKRPVGHRLALLALNRTYGRKEIACDSPRLDQWKLQDGRFVLKFKHAERLSTVDGGPVTGFEVAGIDGKYFKVDVGIDGATLTVSSPEVAKPRYLRYLAHNVDTGNLRNEHGLVTGPFRVSAASDEELLAYLLKRKNLVYEYDLFSGVENGTMKAKVDNSGKYAGRSLDRLYYLFVLKTKTGKTRFVDIGFDTFTRHLNFIAVPGSKVKRNIAVPVSNIVIRTNSSELVSDSEIKRGNLEFFFSSYSAQNKFNIRFAADDKFDSGDAYTSESVPGYGCMQFHSYMASPIFCFNNFAAGNEADLGIGMNRGGQPDWTFSKSGHDYSFAKLYVFAEFD